MFGRAVLPGGFVLRLLLRVQLRGVAGGRVFRVATYAFRLDGPSECQEQHWRSADAGTLVAEHVPERLLRPERGSLESLPGTAVSIGTDHTQVISCSS